MLSGPTYAETVKADAVDRIPQHSEKPLECLKANIINHIGEALTASVSQSFTKSWLRKLVLRTGTFVISYTCRAMRASASNVQRAESLGSRSGKAFVARRIVSAAGRT